MSRNLACTVDDEWLTPPETAALVKLSVQTLANHRHLKIGIPFTKLTSGRAGRVRYRRSDVLRYLAGRKVGAA